jgi:hypothetical protein
MTAEMKQAEHDSIPHQGCGTNQKMLVVGDVRCWQGRGRLQVSLPDCTFLHLSQLDGPVLQQLDPFLVLSPLMSDGFDALDVAERLWVARFAGLYRVVANDLPKPDIIRRDIRSVAPLLNFDLLVLPRLAAS